MATPVGGVDSEPTFGGLSGYRRDVPGRPTSVPGGLPAFRGRTNTPGSAVKTPTIRNSYNRQDRGSNVCIPYARVVPLHHLENVGRVQPGDVVFHSTHRVNRHLSGLRKENEMLRKCLQDPRAPTAFDAYLRTNTTL